MSETSKAGGKKPAASRKKATTKTAAKKTTASKSGAKPGAAKAAPAKPSATASARKAAPRKPRTGNGVAPQERQRRIAEAAYLRAEQRGFQGGDPISDWLAAEAEVDAALRH